MKRSSTPAITSEFKTFPESEGDTFLRSRYEEVLRDSRISVQYADACLDKLREMVLQEGLPHETESERKMLTTTTTTTTTTTGNNSVHMSGNSLRGRLWKAFLRVKQLNAEHYIQLIDKGPCQSHSSMVSDVNRTFRTNVEFNRRVPPMKMKRVLNSYLSHSEHEQHEQHEQQQKHYIQGMSCVLGPLLYTMGELDAFHSFHRLITKGIPLYFHKDDMVGVLAGCRLVDLILEEIDPQLYHIFHSSHSIPSRTWAFEYIVSLMTNQSPFDQVLKLWDFFMAFGFHFCIISIVAQLVLKRERILAVAGDEELNPISKERIIKYLQDMKRSGFDASQIVILSCLIAEKLSPQLYSRICLHTFDESTARLLVVDL